MAFDPQDYDVKPIGAAGLTERTELDGSERIIVQAGADADVNLTPMQFFKYQVIKSKIDAIKEDISNLELSLEGVNTSLSSHDSSISGLNTAVGEIEGTLDGVQGSISGLNTAVGEIEGTLDGVQGSISGLNTAVGEIDSSVETIGASLSNLISNGKSGIDTRTSFPPSLHVHGKLDMPSDSRSVETFPNDYNKELKFPGLKYASTIGLSGVGTYVYLVGLRGWSNTSGGHSHEIAFSNNGIYVRVGTSETTWGAWKTLITY